MIERIEEMPEGTLGFHCMGENTADDYRLALVPPLRELVEQGAEIRLLFVAGPEFEQYDPGALWADAKAGWDLGLRHHALWRRSAVVTEVGWIRKAMGMFAWMAPGEVEAFDLAQLDAAKEWVAG